MQKVRLQNILVASIVCGFFYGIVLSSAPVLGQDKPAAVPDVPLKVLKEMQSQFVLPNGLDAVSQKRMLPPRMEKVLSLGQDAEKKYPNAKNLYKVREIMLHAASYLAKQKDGKVTEKYYYQIARSILNSDAPIETKASIDSTVLTREAFTKKLTAEQIDKKLQVLLKKYKKTQGYPLVVCNAVVLGYQTRNQTLADKYTEILKKDCSKDPNAQKLLKLIEEMQGGGEMVGKTFEAELKTLDGKTLSMPKDTMGQIVVIDFWASWCPACRQLIPHLIKFHAKFATQGVMIIGISLDNNRAAMEKYIKDAGIPWVITYTGKRWSDPTVNKYGIGELPSVWVIGKDGKIVSTKAAGREEQIVSKLLKAEKKTDKK